MLLAAQSNRTGRRLGTGGMVFALRALRHRNYRLYFVGQGISLIGTWMTRVATSWLVYRLTDSALLLGLCRATADFHFRAFCRSLGRPAQPASRTDRHSDSGHAAVADAGSPCFRAFNNSMADSHTGSFSGSDQCVRYADAAGLRSAYGR